jgi:hypothetical protein
LGQAYRTEDVTPDPDSQVRGMLTGSPGGCSRKTYLMTDDFQRRSESQMGDLLQPLHIVILAGIIVSIVIMLKRPRVQVGRAQSNGQSLIRAIRNPGSMRH